MFSWIPYLWSFMNWGPGWLIGCVVTACLVLLGIGVLYEVTEDAGMDVSERVGMCAFATVLGGLVANFWPIVLIGVPFVLVSAGLIAGGRHIVQAFSERA